MLFNSFEFLEFFLLLYFGYVCLHTNFRFQNYLLLVGSLFFYGYWDIRFLTLFICTILFNYTIACFIDLTLNHSFRKVWVTFAVIVDLGIVGLFKYFDFLSQGFSRIFDLIGVRFTPPAVAFILPLGISFYTFQALSYTVDVYRGQLKACRNPLDFGLYISFFPQLVAGPIERAEALLPQFFKKRRLTSEKLSEGFYLILFGLFKKNVVADNLSAIANPIFQYYSDFSGIDLILASLAFTFQIYCDFSGYSDMAMGLAKLMGFDLMRNFNFPYFSKNPREFWMRWHISLSSWFRDYLYIPLGGNKGRPIQTYLNLAITMLLAGLWHGANWTFIVWGAYHAFLLIGHRLMGGGLLRYQRNIFWEGASVVCMFILTMIGWIIFRSKTLHQISYFLTKMSLSFSEFSLGLILKIIATVLPLIAIEFWQISGSNYSLVEKKSSIQQAMVFCLLLIVVTLFSPLTTKEFIYFQF